MQRSFERLLLSLGPLTPQSRHTWCKVALHNDIKAELPKPIGCRPGAAA